MGGNPWGIGPAMGIVRGTGGIDIIIGGGGGGTAI